jgi:ERCC4-type nuclease
MKYKTKAELKNASAEDIMHTAGINKETAEQVYEFVQNEL